MTVHILPSCGGRGKWGSRYLLPDVTPRVIIMDHDPVVRRLNNTVRVEARQSPQVGTGTATSCSPQAAPAEQVEIVDYH